MFLDNDEAFDSVQQLSIAIYLQYLACIEKLLIKCAKCTEGPSNKVKIKKRGKKKKLWGWEPRCIT